jgi:hypothetical protein
MTVSKEVKKMIAYRFLPESLTHHPVLRSIVRALTLLVLTLVLILLAFSAASADQVVFQTDIQVPRTAVLGDQTLSPGSYRLVLLRTEEGTWFTLSRQGKEIARDMTVVIPAREHPIEGVKAEILKGNEYFRIRIREADQVYFVHLLLQS